MMCRVSEEALQDYFEASTADTLVATFKRSRTVFEGIAQRKLIAGDYLENVVSITTKDFNVT